MRKGKKLELLFCHVPKCAGLTMLTILRTIYGDRNVWIDDDFNPPPKGIDVIAGHFRSHKYDNVFPGVPKVTFLRDPIQRVISQFYFHKRSNFPVYRAWWVTKVREGKMDLVEYTEHEGNVLSHYVSREQLDTFEIVGLVEKWSASIKLFFDVFNNGNKVIVDEFNKNMGRSGNNYPVSARQRAKLEQLLSPDYEVYEEALKIWPGRRWCAKG